MKDQNIIKNKFSSRAPVGEPFVWLTALGLSLGLLMIIFYFTTHNLPRCYSVLAARNCTDNSNRKKPDNDQRRKDFQW